MALVLAMLLDAAFGEPKWLWSRMPHPAVLMGRLVQALDDGLNEGDGKRGRGVVAVAVLVAVGAMPPLHASPLSKKSVGTTAEPVWEPLKPNSTEPPLGAMVPFQ